MDQYHNTKLNLVDIEPLIVSQVSNVTKPGLPLALGYSAGEIYMWYRSLELFYLQNVSV